MPESEPRYTNYTLLSIDAWRNEEGGWSWNEHWILERDIVMADSEVTPRKVLRKLREWGYLTEESKGRVYVYDDGSSLEIQAKGTYEPLLALVPEPH